MKAHILDIKKDEEENKVKIQLLNGEAEIKKQEFNHYFYLIPKNERKIQEIKKEMEKLEEVKKAEKTKKKQGKTLKIILNDPNSVKKVKEHAEDNDLGEPREYNIPYRYKYLIDKEIYPLTYYEIETEGEKIKNYEGIEEYKKETPELSKCAFDIEVHSKGKPEPEEDPITLISYKDEEEEKVFHWTKEEGTEKQTIKKLIEKIKKKDKNVIETYNGTRFDWPYLEERAKQNNLELDLGTDGTEVQVRKRGFASSAKMFGRIHLDTYKAVDFLSGIGSLNLPKNTLETVYEEFTGEEKTELTHQQIQEYWEQGGEKLEELKQYNLEDSIAAYKVSEQVIPLYKELTRLIGLPPYDISRQSASNMVEWLLGREAHKKDILIPRRPKKDQIKKRQKNPIKGAYVKTPETGLHEDLVVCDFKSLPEDEQIYLLDPEGQFKIEEIGNFVKKFQQLENKEKKATEIEGWKTLSYDTEEHKVCWKNIKSVITHKNNFDHLLKIKTEKKKEITITPNHSIYTLNEEGKPVVKDAKELTEGDNIIAPKNLPLTNTKTFDLLQILERVPENKKQTLRVFIPRSALPPKDQLQTWLGILKELEEEDKDLEKLDKEMDLNKETIRKNVVLLNEEGLVRYISKKKIKITEKGKNYLNTLKKFSQFHSQSEPRDYLYCDLNSLNTEEFPQELKKKAIIKENNAWWKRTFPVLYTPSKNMCWAWGLFIAEGWCDKNNRRVHFSNTNQETIEKLRKAFEKFKPELVKSENDTEIRVSSKVLSLLLSTLFGSKSKEKKIDGLIFHLEEGKKTDLIKGMIEGDGSKRKRSFKYTSASKRLVEDLNRLLLTIKVFRTSFVKDGELYNLRISGELEDMKKYKGERECHPLALIPREYANEYISPHLKNSHRGPRISSKKTFQDIMQVNTTNNTSKLDFFKGDCGLEKIKKIEKVKYTDHLYDLSVEDTENFFAGKSPVLVHNSLYPTIIVSKHIGPLSLCEDEECEEEHYEAPTGQRFHKKGDSLVPQVVENLIKTRDRVKKKLKETEDEEEKKRLEYRSQALKIIANSVFGYLGYPRARWHSRPCAEAITAWGRQYIKDTIQKAEEKGFNVTYADTDGCFIKLKEEQSLENLKEWLKNINKELPSAMKLEYEGYYPRGVFVSKESGKAAKKKYALLREDGKLEVKGFALVRRDWAPIAKKTQEKVIQKVLKEGKPEKAVKHVEKIVQKLKNKEIDPEELVTYTTMNKNIDNYESIGPHVTAAKKLEKQGYNVKGGTVIGYIIEEGRGSISERSQPIELFQGKKYDHDYYIDNQVIPAAMRVLKELGVKKNNLKYKGKQSELNKWT